MPKTKNARLSLTLPGPLDANGDSAQKPPVARRSSYDTESSTVHKGTEEMGEMQTSGRTQQQEATEIEDALPVEPRSPTITSLPSMPMSPGSGPHNGEQSKSIFSNTRAAKSSAKIPGSDPNSRAGSAPVSVYDGRQRQESRKRSLAGLATSAEGLASSQENIRNNREETRGGADVFKRNEAQPTPPNRFRDPFASPSQPGTPSSEQYQIGGKKGRGFGFMRRNPSHQSEEFRDESSTADVKPQSRDRSDQRGGHLVQSNQAVNPLAANNPQHLVQQKSGFFKALRTGANKTITGMKKQRDKLVKSDNRSTMVMSTTPRAAPDYQYKILYGELIDQVRATRIAPRLEMSRDKTEFWLPALPWRCIDYLNYKGVEEEGIYRHSGSLQHVNYYKQKFDREGDVNLYEETDLYDVNVIASLLKAWLRDLPQPIFPMQLQHEVVKDHVDDVHAPEVLKHAISKLAPWQYYLLFAITCHLSLIAGSADKNKMRIDNLFTCIGSQALKLDANLFGWLVGDWRNCWMGCTDEKIYLEAEYAYLDEKEREAAEESSRFDEMQPPPSSSSRAYSDSAHSGPSNHHISSPLARPNAPRPFGEADNRPGSSRSQSNLRPNPAYQVSQPNDNLYESAPSSANSSGPGSTRATGSRKASQTEMVRSTSDQRSQIQIQSHQPRAPSPLGRRNKQDNGSGSRERSPTGLRPARSEIGTEAVDSGLRDTSRRRAQSQTRSDTSRGKSPNSQGRRRPRGETVGGSPSNRSPSQGAEQPDKAMAGKRRREGGEAPEMPTLQREQRERYEHLTGTGGRSRKGSEVTSKSGGTDSRTERRGEESEGRRSKDRRERDRLPAMERLEIKDQQGSSAAGPEKHAKKDGKYRLSEQSFGEPISPIWKGD